ncbi:hypothetical protein BGZ83_005058 [Gryganskiella cystojenkinii]|nr:hypothetical protein BGZ83_005058 [Gryganskiella cystojenkinii]
MTETTTPKKRRRTPEEAPEREQGQSQRYGQAQEQDHRYTLGQAQTYSSPAAYSSRPRYQDDQDPLSLELAAAASLVSLTTPRITRSTRSIGQDLKFKPFLPPMTTPTVIGATSAPAHPGSAPLSSSSSSSSSSSYTSNIATKLAPTPAPAPASTFVSILVPTSTKAPSSVPRVASSEKVLQLQEKIDQLQKHEIQAQERIKKLEERIFKFKENEKALHIRAENNNKRLKEYREKNKEAEIQLRNQEKRIGTLQLELQKTSPVQPITKAPVGTALRTDNYKRKRGKKLNDDERRLVLHCLEMCRLEQDLSPSIATGDPFLRAAVYLGMSTHTVRDTSMDRNLEDKRTKEERDKRAQGQGQDQDEEEQEQGDGVDSSANGRDHNGDKGDQIEDYSGAEEEDSTPPNVEDSNSQSSPTMVTEAHVAMVAPARAPSVSTVPVAAISVLTPSEAEAEDAASSAVIAALVPTQKPETAQHHSSRHL